MFHVELGSETRRSMFHVEQRQLSALLQCSMRPPRATIRPRSATPGPPPTVISLARYAALLGHPAFRSAILASVLGRLPIGISGLAILMLAQDTTGSFGRGGAVAASYVAGLAAFAPML